MVVNVFNFGDINLLNFGGNSLRFENHTLNRINGFVFGHFSAAKLTIEAQIAHVRKWKLDKSPFLLAPAQKKDLVRFPPPLNIKIRKGGWSSG